jgi:hypothetical protein
MIKMPANQRLVNLSKELDNVIAAYKPLGKIVGEPTSEPKISEQDLLETIKVQRDVLVAPNVHMYYMEHLKDESKIKQLAQALFPSSEFISISGRFHYAPKGYMGWHTNSNMEGWRVYASRAEEDKKSFFRYFKNNRVHTEWEDKGWNFRAFQVIKGQPYWHCVYTDCDRYSFGFRFGL